MKVLKNKNRNAFTWINTGEDFRFQKTVFPKRSGQSIFLSSFDNPLVKYQILTEQLDKGEHLFKIKAFDSLNNVSEETTGSVKVAEYRLAPRFIIHSISGNAITINWEHSVEDAPDNYIIYSNNGSGDIDRTTPLDVISGNDRTYVTTVVDGSWKLVVEARTNNIESFNLFIVETVVPSSAIIPPSMVDENQKVPDIAAENVSVGKMKVSFIWIYGNLADRFRIFHDSGTGTVDFNNPIEFNRQSGFVQSFTTDQIYFDKEDQTFKFVIRSVSPDGVEDGNILEHEVELDGIEPEATTGLEIGSTF